MQRDSGCTSHGGTGDLVGLLSLCLRARLRVPLPPGDSEYPGAGPCFLPLGHPGASPHFPVKFGTSQGRSPRPCGCPGAGPHVPSPLGASTHVCLLELGLQALHGDSNLSPVAVSGGFGCPLGTSPGAVPVMGGAVAAFGGFSPAGSGPEAPAPGVSCLSPASPQQHGGATGRHWVTAAVTAGTGGPSSAQPQAGWGARPSPKSPGTGTGGLQKGLWQGWAGPGCGAEGLGPPGSVPSWSLRGLWVQAGGGQGWAQQGWHPLPLCGTPLCDTPLSGTPWPCLAPLFMAPPCLTALV